MTKAVKRTDNFVEYAPRSEVLSKKARAYLASLKKDPDKREAFLNQLGIWRKDGKLSKGYSSKNSRSHLY